MADTDALMIGLAVTFSIIGIFEIRLLRKKMKNRRVRAPKGDTELPDAAHNAIVTTKAITESLERGGIRSAETSAWIREAEAAYERRNYRVVMELTGKARQRLLALKSAQSQKGDIAKLEQLATVGGAEEVTTKEVLQREVAPNLVQSKFSIELAGSAVEQARVAGRDVGQATEFLDAAKARFDAKDYDGALSLSRLSKRAADGLPTAASAPTATAVPPSPAPPTSAARSCPSCGAAIAADDAFCRKCGTPLAPPTCASCGADLLPDDAFCRKCGARISP